jgi:hypothetical protein
LSFLRLNDSRPSPHQRHNSADVPAGGNQMSSESAFRELRLENAVALCRDSQNLLRRIEENSASRNDGDLLAGGLRIKLEPDHHRFGARYETRV